MLAAVMERPGAVVARHPPGEPAQARALAEAVQARALALAASERPEQLKIYLDVARP